MSFRIWRYAGPPPYTSKTPKLYLDLFAIWRTHDELPLGHLNNSLVHTKGEPCQKFLEKNKAFIERIEEAK